MRCELEEVGNHFGNFGTVVAVATVAGWEVKGGVL